MAADEPEHVEPAPRKRQRIRDGRPERPPAPWGSFPLVELVILLGLVLIVVGLAIQGKQGLVMLLAGLALGALGGIEVSIREHFAGYKSHSMLLAGVVAAIIGSAAFLAVPASWTRAVPFAIGAVVFGGCFYLFRESFKRRSGGLGFRGGFRP